MKRLSGILLILFAFSVFADEIQVLNEGIGGHNTRNALARIYESAIAYAPQCVIVGFGCNDVCNYAALVPAGEYEENLNKIIQQLKEANVREIVLNTPHPIIESYLRARSPKLSADYDINGTIRQYREIVQKVAREQNIQVLDIYEMVARNNDPSEAKESMLRNIANSSSRDGVHFTADAYQKIVDALYELLKNRIKPGDKIVCFGDSLTYGANLAGAGTVTGKNYPSFLWKKFNPIQGNPTRMRSKLEAGDGSVLPNGGFEFANASNMPYKWVLANNPKHIGEVRTGDSPEGTRFFHMENNGSNKTLFRTDFIRENGKFAFSCLVRGEGKLEAMAVLYGGKMTRVPLVDADLTGTWQKIEGNFEVLKKEFFGIMLQAHKSADIDEVKVLPSDLVKKSFNESLTLQNSKIAVSFAQVANGGGVISIRNQEGTEFVNCAADGAFWGMRLKKIAPAIANLPPVINLACDPEQDDGGGHRNEDKSASDLMLNSAKLVCASAQQKQSAGKIRFEWQGIALGTENGVLDVWAEATLQSDGDFCYFDGGFENRSKFYTVYYFELPRISGLGAINVKPENDFWALPFYNGRLIKNPVEKGLLGKNHQFAANVSGHSMQFDALYNEENGLYLGTFDPEQNVKRYTLDSNGRGVVWAILNVPDNMRQVPQKWTIPYSSGIRVFHGDWYDACQIYRQWALQQSWTQGGPLAINKNISLVFRDADDSIAVSSAMIDDTEPGYTRKFLETYKDYKIIVWLTHWGLDNTHFDGPNPDRFPLTELDHRAIAYLKERKIPIRPYIQCTEWDSGTPSFKAHADAENNIVSNYYGQRIRWGARKGATTHRYIAYPGVLWRSVLGETVEKMAESGFDGAYMDSGNHGGMYMNFTPACSNSTGGGADYVKNNQKLLSEIRERTHKINPNFSVDAESFWEGNIAVLDGFLTCNTTNAYLEAERVTAIPLVQTVYHDYTVMYSFWPSGSDVARDNALPYAAKLGLAYTWGVKPGMTLPQLDWKFGNEQEIQRIHKNRFEGYAKTKKYLIYGQLLRMPPITGRTQVPVKWHRTYSANYYAIFMDSVLCTAWRMLNGDFALAMYNITETPVEIIIRLNKKEYLIDDIAFSAMHPADLKFEQTADAADILLKVTVPSRMPTMLEHLKKQTEIEK